MHELSLCENLLDILKQQAVTERFTQVKRIRLDIGPFSCVEPEALRFGFDAVMRGTLAEGAVLEIAQPSGSALCLTCLQTIEVRSRLDPCPLCGADLIEVRGGDDLKISELEVV